MPKKRSKDPQVNYSWDSSVILAWLWQEEQHDLASIDAVAGRVDGGADHLLLSVMVVTELLEAKNPPSVMAQFRAWTTRTNVHMLNIDMSVALKAGEIRSRAFQEEGRSIKTPDAQIIATAIIYGAHVLHSVDDKVLKLNGKPFVDGLRICKPCLHGRDLFG